MGVRLMANIVPADDLPANIVPEHDLPDSYKPSMSEVVVNGLGKLIPGVADQVLNAPNNLLNLGKMAVGTAMTAAGKPPATDSVLTPQANPDFARRIAEKINLVRPEVVPQGFEQKAVDLLIQGAGTGALTGGATVPRMLAGAGMGALSAGAAGATEEATGSPAAGAIAGLAVPAGVSRMRNTEARSPETQMRNASIDATAANSRAAGYTIPPTQTNPTMVNRALEGVAGKITTAQQASAHNATITDSLAKRSLGLPPQHPITEDALNAVRTEAGRSYEAVKSYGANMNLRFRPDQQFTTAVNNLGRDYSRAARDFPEIAGNEAVAQLRTALTNRNISPETAIELSKKLRFDASVNFKSDDPMRAELAHSQRTAATAIEDLIDRRLAMSGQPELIRNFRQARQTMARSYDIESALNNDTGHVSAQKLSALSSKGKPLGADLQTAASFATAFPKAAQKPETIGSQPGFSPLDLYAAGGIGGVGYGAGGTAGMMAGLLPLARPSARAGILSGPYQRTMGVRTYSDGQPVAGQVAPIVTNGFLQDIQPRESGGPVTAGKPYLVGERGPELVVPSKNATVIPTGTLAALAMQMKQQGPAWAKTENAYDLVQLARLLRQ